MSARERQAKRALADTGRSTSTRIYCEADSALYEAKQAGRNTVCAPLRRRSSACLIEIRPQGVCTRCAHQNLVEEHVIVAGSDFVIVRPRDFEDLLTDESFRHRNRR